MLQYFWESLFLTPIKKNFYKPKNDKRMNYYLDQEFHEYFKKPISWLPTIGNFNKPYHTIELISIGIVAEDGREYYAVCNEFDVKSAFKNDWLYTNVLMSITGEFYLKNYIPGEGINGRWNLNKPQPWMIKQFGKSKKQIMIEVVGFIFQDDFSDFTDSVKELVNRGKEYGWSDEEIKFYGYYADYDWVLFCSLFGTMMDLPKGFPMYCKDLQQMKDDYRYLDHGSRPMLKPIEQHPEYPKQKNEHHALSDAKWNLELHNFLKSIKMNDEQKVQDNSTAFQDWLTASNIEFKPSGHQTIILGETDMLDRKSVV